MKQVAYFLIWMLSLVAVPAFATVGVVTAVYAVREYKADYGWVDAGPAMSNPCVVHDYRTMSRQELETCAKQAIQDTPAPDPKKVDYAKMTDAELLKVLGDSVELSSVKDSTLQDLVAQFQHRLNASQAAYDEQLRALTFFDRYLKPLNLWLALGTLVSFGLAAASVRVVRWSWNGMR